MTVLLLLPPRSSSIISLAEVSSTVYSTSEKISIAKPDEETED